MADRDNPRVLGLSGATNFRDFGGYETVDGRSVRSGRLFRSDNLSRLSRLDLDRLRGLGIRTIADLRTENERATRPNRLPAGAGISSEHLPISIIPELEKRWTTRERIGFVLGGHVGRLDGARLLEAYRHLPGRAALPLRRLFAVLGDPRRAPLLVVCMGGKDRTGFCVAMILAALGVPIETALEDYDLTNACAAQRVDRAVRVIRMLTLHQVREESLRPFLQARREYMAASLESIRFSHGTVAAYLEDAAGLTPDAREALRASLLV